MSEFYLEGIGETPAQAKKRKAREKRARQKARRQAEKKKNEEELAKKKSENDGIADQKEKPVEKQEQHECQMR